MVGRLQNGFQIIVSLDLSFENWPTCTACTVVEFWVCMWFSAYLCECTRRERTPPPTIIRMSQSLPFHFSKKKKLVYKKSICKRSQQTVQHFAVSFSFCTALRLRQARSLSPHYLPAPSVFLNSISHQTNRACPAFRRNYSEQLSACRILSELSSSSQGRRRVMAV